MFSLFGRVSRFDSAGNAVILPESYGKPVLLANSSDLDFTRGTRVEYCADKVFGRGRDLDRARIYSAVDFGIHDVSARRVVVLGRASPSTYTSSRHAPFLDRVAALNDRGEFRCSEMGFVLETRPPVAYCVFDGFEGGETRLARLLGAVGLPFLAVNFPESRVSDLPASNFMGRIRVSGWGRALNRGFCKYLALPAELMA